MSRTERRVTYRGFPPEEQQFLRGRHLVVVHGHLPLARGTGCVDNARLEEHEGDGRYATP